MNFIARAVLRKETMNWLKAHWPAISGVVAVVLPFELPSINAYIAAHPHTTLGVLLAAVVAMYYKQSPLKPKP